MTSAISHEAFDPAILAAVCSPNLAAAAERIVMHKTPMRLREAAG